MLMTIRALTLAWPPADRAASAAGARALGESLLAAPLPGQEQGIAPQKVGDFVPRDQRARPNL